ncbi:TetR/AcrR family transcriptional regulator [Spongisporangium articulatum]|uniref:TetR/AcrR family transcriptional regulator n=1 Tax=Spongisporangium articulatum TaxID=3362603 RepID=A0ABW8AMC2_9ACTN
MTDTLDTAAARPLRADAERNRRRILAAAAVVYARSGLEAGFDEIAREAGVGVGTVYRRFPHRDDLLLALFEAHLDAMVTLVEECEATRDAGAGLRRLIETLIENHVRDRGLKELMFSQADCAARMGEHQATIVPVLNRVIERAKQEGSLRPDVQLADVMLAVFMVTSAGSITADLAPEQWRRQFAVLWAGLSGRADDAPLPSTPLSVEQLTVAFNQG